MTRNASDILALQQDLAEDLSERLRDELTAADRKRLARQRTANPEAYRHYVEGRYEWNRRTGPSFRSAIYAFQRAIELDSRYALAWAGLADTYILQATYNEVPPIVALPMARAAAERALALDPDLAEAHTSLAYYLLNYDSDVNGAEREFRRAISLNPSYATAHHWYSLCLIAKKEQQQAIASIGRAVRLDPLSPIIRAEAGAILVDAGRLAEARTECMEALRIDPKFAFALHILAAIELREHHPEKAIALSKQAWELGQDPRPLARMGQIHAQAGRTVEARQVLDLLIARSRERFVSPLLIARLAVAVGDRATALEWLERATRELAPGPLQRQLREDPQLEPLRGDPRFLRLLRD